MTNNLSIYNEYDEHGVSGYYEKFADSYYNPHEQSIISILNQILPIHIKEDNSILDFACGDGLISKYIMSNFCNKVEGSDPYFQNKYVQHNFSFDDVIKGKQNFYYDVIICCYAYHLLHEKKRNDFLTQLALKTKKFIIITPSKKICTNHMLWKTTLNTRINKITIIIMETLYDF